MNLVDMYRERTEYKMGILQTDINSGYATIGSSLIADSAITASRLSNTLSDRLGELDSRVSELESSMRPMIFTSIDGPAGMQFEDNDQPVPAEPSPILRTGMALNAERLDGWHSSMPLLSIDRAIDRVARDIVSFTHHQYQIELSDGTVIRATNFTVREVG
jgi:hypothetical protein